MKHAEVENPDVGVELAKLYYNSLESHFDKIEQNIRDVFNNGIAKEVEPNIVIKRENYEIVRVMLINISKTLFPFYDESKPLL